MVRYVPQSKEDQNIVEETGIKIILQCGKRGSINAVKSTD